MRPIEEATVPIWAVTWGILRDAGRDLGLALGLAIPGGGLFGLIVGLGDGIVHRTLVSVLPLGVRCAWSAAVAVLLTAAVGWATGGFVVLRPVDDGPEENGYDRRPPRPDRKHDGPATARLSELRMTVRHRSTEGH